MTILTFGAIENLVKNEEEKKGDTKLFQSIFTQSTNKLSEAMVLELQAIRCMYILVGLMSHIGTHIVCIV